MRSTFVLLVLAATASAHTRMFSIWLNGADQGDGRNEYIRSPPTNSPIKDLTSPDLVCNVNGAVAVPRFVTAAAGDTLTFEWYHDTRGDDIIAPSHKGPIITYVAPYVAGAATGAIWTKIAESGYDATTSKWAVDALIAADGKIDVVLPAGLKAGKYLVRQEIIALHEADNAYDDGTGRGAQFYPSCAQLEVTGAGTQTPDEDFDFNVGYTTADNGIVFNLYAPFTSYDIPGPAVWDATGESSSASTVTTTATMVATSAAPATTAASATASASAGGAATTTMTTAAAAATSKAPNKCSRRRHRHNVKN